MDKKHFVKPGADKEKIQRVLAKLSKEQLASIVGGEFGETPFGDNGSYKDIDPPYIKYANYSESTQPRR